MNRELIISSTSTGVDIALIEDGALVELHHEATDVPFQVGDVFAARIKKPAPSMNAVFVDIGSDKDAFLHYTDLCPQLQSLKKYVAAAINGKLAALNLQGFQLEADIIKNGKITDVLGKRDALLVQINKEPIGAKGSRLSSDITLAGRYIVLTPFSNVVAVSKKIKEDAERKRLQKIVESIKPANFGVIVRTAAEGRKVNEIHEDINAQVARWEGVTKMLRNANLPIKVMSELSKTVGILRDLLNESFNRIVVNDKEMYAEIKNFIKEIAPEKEKIVMLHTNNTPVFDQYKVTKQIKSSFGKNVSLSSGAYLVIEPTEAMHVIDVNSGNKMTVTGNQELNALTINLEAANEIARQLRLRDIGGIIVIDFIDMNREDHKRKVLNALKEALSQDHSKTEVNRISPLGLVEMTRARAGNTVESLKFHKCPYCEGRGRVKID